MRTAQIRKRFLDYFEAHGHANIPGSSLVPGTDPSLLFSNSGMVQFKNVFLGAETRDYKRACSAQLCLRAGGKHNDLENVGYTARHHTLFEMLGNFSFGDYFKEAAIDYAWDFLTDNKKGLGIDPRHLWITVFGGGAVFGKDGGVVQGDSESATHWQTCLKKSGFSEADIQRRITQVHSADNFWMMGDTGPCGPCTEIFYHPDIDMQEFTGMQDAHADECVEIWNLVFMQYNRVASGALEALPHPCVDTGMGLERVAAVLQGVSGNYETELFTQLMQAVNQAVVAAGGTDVGVSYAAAHRVIADHARAAAFVILDGVIPSNEGRGYVLRRIVRRALRHAYQLGARGNCLDTLVKAVAKCMDHKALSKNVKHVSKVLATEEERFRVTLKQGMDMLDAFFEDAQANNADALVVDGETAFQLYDTYGFPPDLTADIAREHSASVDMQGFDVHMERQRALARDTTRFKDAQSLDLGAGSTEFCGYGQLSMDAKVQRLISGSQHKSSDSLSRGQEGGLIVDSTPFYPQGGGQVGDRGIFYDAKDNPVFEVADTTRVRDLILHHGKALQPVKAGQKLVAKVDAVRRAAIVRNHSATHLLHASLIEVLGSHVKQKGSLVDADKLRFDFSHHEPLSADTLQAIEDLANEQIMLNTETRVELMDRQEANKRGAIALFGEKYGDRVRVLTMGEGFSVELCGGTHVQRTGDIGMLLIIEESGVSAGVRRIEALTATNARTYCHRQSDHLQEAATQLKCPPESVSDKIKSMHTQQRAMQKELHTLRQQVAAGGTSDSKQIWEDAHEIEGIKVLASMAPTDDAGILRDTVDRCRDRLGDSVVFLVAQQKERLLLAAGVSKSVRAKINALDLMRYFAPRLGGKGGGKADFAQGGGDNLAMVDTVLKQIPEWVENHLR